MTPETLDLIVRLILGGSLLTGLGVLVRALAKRGSVLTDSAERTVILQERAIEKRQVRIDALEEELAGKDHMITRMHRQLLDLGAVVRAYERRHGELSDPNLRRIQAGQRRSNETGEEGSA